MPEQVRSRRKVRIGRVLKNKMDKTVVVAVERFVVHPRYKKRIRRIQKLYAHDKDNQCNIGDVVKVIESRPLSKLKRWRVSQIIERAK